jgi:hypothetical protein
MFNGSSSYGESASSVAVREEGRWGEGRWQWLFCAWPIQDRCD